MKHIGIFFLLLATCMSVGTMTLPNTVAAEESLFQVQGSNYMTASLQRHVGQKITLRLLSGEELSGTLRTVGQESLHLAELQGRDFFDALVRLDQIAALIVKAK